MNPTAQTLDPKLKETYDRVMGTQLPPQPDQKPQPAPQPAQEVHLPVENIPPAPTPTPPPVAAEPEMVNINATVPQHVAPAAVSKKKFSPIIFVVAGAGFLLIYTFIWLKVFKLF